MKDTERATILTEAFAAETYATLLPQYYEVVLKNRYFKDVASSQMMDIMYETVNFDFVRLFDGQISMVSAINNAVTGTSNNFSSLVKSTMKVGEKKLSAMLESINKNIVG